MINMVKSAFLLKILLVMQEFFLAKIHVIDEDNHNYNAVITRIRTRQEGLCRFCAERIKESDTIISKSYSRSPKYFHRECAERIHLL
jgi:hypothetical protein